MSTARGGVIDTIICEENADSSMVSTVVNDTGVSGVAGGLEPPVLVLLIITMGRLSTVLQCLRLREATEPAPHRWTRLVRRRHADSIYHFFIIYDFLLGRTRLR